MFGHGDTGLMWLMSIEHIHLVIYIFCLIAILVSDKPSSAMVSWIFAITVFPVIGIVLYLLFGINWRKNRAISNREKQEGRWFRVRNFLKYDPVDFFLDERFLEKSSYRSIDKENISDSEIEIVKLLATAEKTTITRNKSYEIYYSGKEAFDSIIKDISEAKESILMEYFIWRSDKLGQQIKDLLVKKAKEGVKIRLLFDGLGSFRAISKKYRRELLKAGIEFRYFLDIKFALSKLNYRNHRKMTIIDSKILHTGGMNLGEEYITGGSRFNEWRDTNFRVEGELVIQYLTIFITDWLNSGGKNDFETIKLDEIVEKNIVKDDEKYYLMQVSSSGPDTEWTSLKYLYSKLISSAKREVLIQSPYFVPDSALVNQLTIMALAGIKIKIIMTGVPDKKIPYWIAETYFEELTNAGIEIFRYKAGFLHCKNIVVDGEFSTIGTCNFDMRSLEINYEINSVFYNREISQNVRNQFFKDLEKCEKVEKKQIEKKAFWKRIRNSLFKLVSPIM